MSTAVVRSCWHGRAHSTLLVFALLLLLVGCNVTPGIPPSSAPAPPPPASAPPTTARRLTTLEAERLQRIMVPLLQHMHQPLAPRQVPIAVLADPEINAANAGSWLKSLEGNGSSSFFATHPETGDRIAELRTLP